MAPSAETPADRPLFDGYAPPAGTHDEMFGPGGAPRPGVERAVELLAAMGRAEFVRRQRIANTALLRGGITFSVRGEGKDLERIFPFDMIPRIVDAPTWERLERGLIQRVRALDAFLGDVYGDQRILGDGVVPREVVESSAGYLRQVRGMTPRHGVHVHIAGIDLVRTPSGEFLVLEDNARTPSGVSYVLENRAVMKRAIARVFESTRVRAVDEYPQRLYDALVSLAPPEADEPRVVVLTPGRYNSAYFEHSFLAGRMGCELVEASDLVVHDDRVWVKTTAGLQRVHVIYRRTDDEFIDPEVFRADSLLGVPGLVRAYAKGTVTLTNALGNGVADDKAIYPYVPAIVRYYLAEEPLLGQVETLSCARPDDCRRVLDELDRMVVKQVDASGGYGMLMGPSASRAELAAFAERIRANPRSYIAQPRVELSTCPTWVDGVIAPRRVDLRPYVITGRSTWVLPGGLTRVALANGSYIVNSSQGGGSKDTWVLEA